MLLCKLLWHCVCSRMLNIYVVMNCNICTLLHIILNTYGHSHIPKMLLHSLCNTHMSPWQSFYRLLKILHMWQRTLLHLQTLLLLLQHLLLFILPNHQRNLLNTRLNTRKIINICNNILINLRTTLQKMQIIILLVRFSNRSRCGLGSYLRDSLNT